MRSRRLQNQRARLPQPPPEPESIVLPGCEADQAAEERERDLNAAWYEDPSYAERLIDREAIRLFDEYMEWLNKESSGQVRT